jgi:hypothetical protein
MFMERRAFKYLFSVLIVVANLCPGWAKESGISTEQPEQAANSPPSPSSVNKVVRAASASDAIPTVERVSSDAGATEPRTPSNQRVADSTIKANNASGSPAHASLPKKCLSTLAAAVIGTPVCVVRRTKYEEWYAAHGMVGDSDSKILKALAATFWFPFAAIDGTAEAPFDAVANGLMYPAFSQDQMSKGKLIQNN